MSEASLMYWNEKLGRSQPRKLILAFEITAAKTFASLEQAQPALVSADALTQAQIDDFLSNKFYTSSSEFTAAQFDATSMGDDMFGGVIDMAKQCDRVQYMQAKCYSGTAGSTLVERAVKVSAALQNSTLATEVAVSSEGNIGFKIDFGNTPDFDGLTAGLIIVELAWISK